MPADGFPIKRIDLDESTSVWVPAEEVANPSGPPVDAPPARVWRVRPAAIALGAVLASCALLRHGATAEGLLAAVVLGALGVLTVIDLEHHLLPNRIVGPAAIATIALQAVLFPGRLPECLAAAAVAALLLLIPSLIRRGAVGMGDVKLAGVLGAALGGKVLAAMTLASLASVPVALAMLARGSGRRATLPLGPFLTFGAAVVLLA